MTAVKLAVDETPGAIKMSLRLRSVTEGKGKEMNWWRKQMARWIGGLIAAMFGGN